MLGVPVPRRKDPGHTVVRGTLSRAGREARWRGRQAKDRRCFQPSTDHSNPSIRDELLELTKKPTACLYARKRREVPSASQNRQGLHPLACAAAAPSTAANGLQSPGAEPGVRNAWNLRAPGRMWYRDEPVSW